MALPVWWTKLEIRAFDAIEEVSASFPACSGKFIARRLIGIPMIFVRTVHKNTTSNRRIVK
jgi:hypothetical protein